MNGRSVSVFTHATDAEKLAAVNEVQRRAIAYDAVLIENSVAAEITADLSKRRNVAREDWFDAKSVLDELLSRGFQVYRGVQS